MTATPIAITAEAMEARLREVLAPTQLQVLDESWQHEGHPGANGTGFGTHFRVRIASPRFAGQRKVAQHRLVYDALQIFIDHGAHAIAIETL
ncbi:MAG TPA: BolA family protein [Alicycliphilus sp.]|jgi:BolA family transcriptional regulator, general stress-responsive regulator|uniref:BolA family protein n=1 Tax=Diaphorobacter limosus TaxID=3036128 RepID=A0ABZ0J7H7_9BURK|nr:BolA family protein [Diaphorobacter sp. Y-1]MBP6751856.1 BolA family transcriptional regulator [Alicycliphilus sp.]MCA0439807.1 BolA family transcriptional regulator [Pseudomonadota bacterium]MBP7327930.1 BolA family transcriptional regulator [Alicycliphilus sp.]TXJ10115.1 MAG: BolA family transcriptional regulator [Alicycliphilus sp.]WOO33425.1 BolA family protein [Diaphorobacter sp. Y-1]